MLARNPKAQRIIAVPFVALGIVALSFLVRGKKPPKTPESLLAHLAEEGIYAELGEAWMMEEIGETYWPLKAGGRTFTLRKAQSVVAAMSEYKAVNGSAGSVPAANPLFGPSEIYRNEVYLLELEGQGDDATTLIGQAFEDW